MFLMGIFDIFKNILENIPRERKLRMMMMIVVWFQNFARAPYSQKY
jgi:hypothetical protein